MRVKKINILPIFVAMFFVAFSTFDLTFAEEDPKISKKREESIIKNCDSIHESLKATQRSDAYARTYLGAIYETVLNQFITPLNVRLLKNNNSFTDFTNFQTDLVSTRSDFNSSFITYSKSLESLIAIDCKTSPEDFYSKLREVRKERKVVDGYAKKLEQLISAHKQKVSDLEQKL